MTTDPVDVAVAADILWDSIDDEKGIKGRLYPEDTHYLVGALFNSPWFKNRFATRSTPPPALSPDTTPLGYAICALH